MAYQQLFYRKVSPVSFQRHGDVSVRAGKDFGFAREANAIPLTAAEFGPASAEYPIVFAGEGDSIFPVAVVGVREGENLFVREDGSWAGEFIPVFVRRYPFVFSVDAEATRFTLHIDEDYEGVNREGRGERLFDAEGEQTQYLKNVLGFLQDYQARFTRTQAFCKRLVELELTQPMRAQFELSPGERRTLGGFQVVDREKLKGLSDADLGDMCRKDELECLYMHLASLRHFRGMLERLRGAASTRPAARDGSEAPAEAEAETLETSDVE